MERFYRGVAAVVLLLVIILQCGAWTPGKSLSCSIDADCLAINASSCVGGNCTCSDEERLVLVSQPDENATYCLQAFNETGGSCVIIDQCQYNNSMCSKERECGCKPRFMVKDKLCEPYTKSALIPVAVGVAIGVSVLLTLVLYLILARRKMKAESSHSK